MKASSAVLAVTVFVGAATMPLKAQSAAGQAAAAQSGTGNQPVFDVASVKPNKSGNRPTSNFPLGTGGRLRPQWRLFHRD